MPRQRKATVSRRRRDLNGGKVDHLLLGVDVLGDVGYGIVDIDLDQLRVDWEGVRVDAIQYWSKAPGWEEIRQHEPFRIVVDPDGPGHRPWAWWEFDAPEPREVAGMKETIVRGSPPSVIRTPILEPELEYLERHGLLLPHEKPEATT